MKQRIIGSGNRICDSWNGPSGSPVEVWIEGGNIMSKTATSGPIVTKSFGSQNVKELIWKENGSIEAVLDNGNTVYVSNISPTPGKYSPYDYEISEPQKQSVNSKEEKTNSKSKKRTKVNYESDDDDKDPLWWVIIKGFFKGIWWMIKGIWNLFWGMVEGVDRFGR